jgi:two-component system, cell cycle response regulator CpdR
MKSVVVIDDDEPIRRTLGVLLERAGYAVVLAPDGEEGLRRCRAAVPDLVMTDIHLPGIDGIEVALALRTLAPALPVIVMSGGDRTERLDLLGSALLLGAVRVLRKPFTIDEALSAIEAALGG